MEKSAAHETDTYISQAIIIVLTTPLLSTNALNNFNSNIEIPIIISNQRYRDWEFKGAKLTISNWKAWCIQCANDDK